MSKTAQIESRRSQVIKLRLEGNSLRAIAQTLGVALSTVHGDLTAMLQGLKDAQKLCAEEYLTLELERLDMATQAIAQRVQEGHLGAIDRWLKISERRAKLLGLDKAPQQSIDVLCALKVLIENGILPPQIVGLAGDELTRATEAITAELGGAS